jgi:hypothetical protein
MFSLAPYNNAMRIGMFTPFHLQNCLQLILIIGQGFNSYTQKICIDDAVVIDPTHIDNPITNDGFTMRDLVVAMGSENGASDDTEPLITAASQMKPDEAVLDELQKAVNLLEVEVEEAQDISSEETVRKRKLLEQKRVRLAKNKTQLAAALSAVDKANLAKHYAKRGPAQVCS